MYLPDNLSNSVHLMKISPFRFATVEMTEETSQVATTDGISLQPKDRENFAAIATTGRIFNQITKSRFPEVQKQILG